MQVIICFKLSEIDDFFFKKFITMLYELIDEDEYCCDLNSMIENFKTYQQFLECLGMIKSRAKEFDVLLIDLEESGFFL